MYDLAVCLMRYRKWPTQFGPAVVLPGMTEGDVLVWFPWYPGGDCVVPVPVPPATMVAAAVRVMEICGR